MVEQSVLIREIIGTILKTNVADIRSKELLLFVKIMGQVERYMLFCDYLTPKKVNVLLRIRQVFIHVDLIIYPAVLKKEVEDSLILYEPDFNAVNTISGSPGYGY